MTIQEKLLEFRLPLIASAATAVAVISFLRHGPSFATVVNFFGPLLLSTGFFLGAVALLLRISPPPADSSGGVTGQELMDYVAGRTEDEAGAGEGSGGREPDEEHSDQ